MSLGNNLVRAVAGFFSGSSQGKQNGDLVNGDQTAALDSEGKRDHMLPTCVEDVMTRSVVTLYHGQTFGEAVALMANRPFRHILVVERDVRLVGIISDRDLLRILARGHEWKNIAVEDIMTKNMVTVRPQTPLSVAVGDMLARRINCLPVVDGADRLCGIVTSTDLLTAFQKIQASLERVTRHSE